MGASPRRKPRRRDDAVGPLVSNGQPSTKHEPNERRALQHVDCVVVGEAEGIWPKVLADVQRGRFRGLYRAETAGVDAIDYLRDVLERIASTPISRLRELLPDRWRAAQA